VVPFGRAEEGRGVVVRGRDYGSVSGGDTGRARSSGRAGGCNCCPFASGTYRAGSSRVRPLVGVAESDHEPVAESGDLHIPAECSESLFEIIG
jgi:hypothetical protein